MIRKPSINAPKVTNAVAAMTLTTLALDGDLVGFRIPADTPEVLSQWLASIDDGETDFPLTRDK